VEAGTGTGKTLAYLVSAILSGRKVIVSTATRALQEQIFAKDLPLVAAALQAHGVSFRASLMKGLGNYVCLAPSERSAGVGGARARPRVCARRRPGERDADRRPSRARRPTRVEEDEMRERVRWIEVRSRSVALGPSPIDGRLARSAREQ